MSTAFRIEMDNVQEVPDSRQHRHRARHRRLRQHGGHRDLQHYGRPGSISATVLGTGEQTPDPGDDIHGIHVHNAARGVNGSVVFGQRGPTQDADDFAIVENSNGTTTFSGIWETTDPASSSLNNFAAALGAATLGSDVPLSWNIHTEEFGGGEIRGQWVCIATDNGETVEGTDGDDVVPGTRRRRYRQRRFGDRPVEGGNDPLDGGSGRDTASYAGAAAGVTVALGNAAAQNTVGAGTDTLSIDRESHRLELRRHAVGHLWRQHRIGRRWQRYAIGLLRQRHALRRGRQRHAERRRPERHLERRRRRRHGDLPERLRRRHRVARRQGEQNTVGDGTDTLSSIENLIGSNFADTLTGSSGDNTMSGSSNDDSLTGGAGGTTR